jgi:hypothetical protein
MSNLAKGAVLGCFLGIGLMAAAPANADEIIVRPAPGPNVIIEPDGIHDHWREDHWRHDDWRDRPHFCTPERALWKADRMGVRHARIAYENPRAIRIRGHDRRGFIELTFGRAPDCPLLR